MKWRRRQQQREPVDRDEAWQALLYRYRTKRDPGVTLAVYKARHRQAERVRDQGPPARFPSQSRSSSSVYGPPRTYQPPSEDVPSVTSDVASDAEPSQVASHKSTEEPRPLTFTEQNDALQRAIDGQERAWHERTGDSPREQTWDFV